jgi:hypothetical protein
MPRPRKPNQVRINFRTSAIAEARVVEILKGLGYPHGDRAAYGKVFEALANGDLELRKKKSNKPLDG